MMLQRMKEGICEIIFEVSDEQNKEDLVQERRERECEYERKEALQILPISLLSCVANTRQLITRDKIYPDGVSPIRHTRKP